MRLAPLLFTLALTIASAAHGQPGRLTLKTERVVVFKNGYGLVVKTATGTADDLGQVYTAEVPESAVLGSFWVMPGEDVVVKSVRATEVALAEDVRHAGQPANIMQLLAANVGKTVTLHPSNTHFEPVSGVIAEVLHGWTDPNTPNTVAQVVVKEASGKTTVMPAAAVARVEGEDLSWSYDFKRPGMRSEKRLIVSVAPKQRVELQMIYFTPNIRWIPTYRLEGISKPEAQIWLQGEILNELESLEGVPLSLVVGVPSFRFENVVSPLSLEPMLHNALNQAAPGLMGQQAYQTQFRNDFNLRASESRGESNVPANLPDPGNEGLAAGEQDLYVYDVGPMTLNKGDRAAIPIWNASAPATHVYTFDLAVQRTRSGSCTVADKNDAEAISQMNQRGGSPLQVASTRVWHQLELTNTSRNPWTTGPAIAFDNGIPIAQDLLTYTSSNGKTLLPLTVATDIRGSYTEEELKREPNVLRWGSHDYSRVTKRCTITLTSYRREASDVRCSVSLGGKASNASNEGKVTLTDAQARDWDDSSWFQVNNHSDVSWSLSLEPGQSVTLTFDVMYYLH